MVFDDIVLIGVLATSFITAMIIFLLPEKSFKLRTTFNLTGNIIKIIFVFIMIIGLLNGLEFRVSFEFINSLEIVLMADHFTILFATLSAVLWFITTIYAIGYLEHSPNRSRFFGFFSLCITATMGIALSGNLFTFLLFYEMLTITTYPLVIHRGTTVAINAGNTYLKYTIGGGSLLLIGTLWLYSINGSADFLSGGSLSSDLNTTTLIIIFTLIIAGLGVKSAIVPLHGWLPLAMIAPAPVSALLHAVAVVKAGAFGIVRVIYDLFGVVTIKALSVAPFLLTIASITIIYGSIRALYQDNLKKRLAYSTISQVSYIILGIAMLSPIAGVGGVVHLFHQGIMKITLFFVAGNLAETLNIHNISDMHGVAKRMPITMIAFSIGAFGMIGLPPLAGFVSKWYLGVGAVEAGNLWVLIVLFISAFLNALYFLPIIYVAWFKKAPQNWKSSDTLLETRATLLLPTIITAIFTILAGIFVGGELSLAQWAKSIVEIEYK